MNREIVLTAGIWGLTLIFFVLACVRCRRVRVLPSIFILICVTFFSLLSPAGEVLLTIGRFKITLDSLLLGLRRSGILVGMVFLSRVILSSKTKDFSVNSDSTRQFWRFSKNKIFETSKNKLTEVFYYLGLLTEKKITFKRGHIIEAIDERLCEIWEKS